MSSVIVTDSLSVPFQVFEDSGTIEEKIGIGLLHLALCLRVCLEGEIQLFSVLIVYEEVGEVRVSKNIYTVIKLVSVNTIEDALYLHQD